MNLRYETHVARNRFRGISRLNFRPPNIIPQEKGGLPQGHPDCRRIPNQSRGNLKKPPQSPEGIRKTIKFQHRFLIDFWSQNDPTSTPKTIRNRSKNRSRIQCRFLTMFNQSWALQTLKNIKKPKENLCFSRVGLFRIDHHFDQKTFNNDS